MAEELENDKPIDTKGISTVTGNDTDPPKKKDDFVRASERKFTPALEYREPTSAQDAFNMAASGRIAEGGSSNIKGFTGSIDTKALQDAYAKVDLAEGIPDAYEREKFRSENGTKMVELFDENSVGVRFERDLEDVYKFKEKQYPYAVKKFIDELDENQAWYSEVGNIVGKAVGETFLNVFGGLGGAVYGAFSALVNWDYEKFWNNDWWEGLDQMVEDVDKSRVVYGGSDYWKFNPNAQDGNYFEQKDFLARFISDPMKSLNADIVPTAAFVAGIVGQELIAGAITAGTGGLGSGTMAAGMARGTQGLQRGAGWANRMTKTGKALRYIRGLEKVDDLAKAAQLQNMTNKYHKAIGQISSMYRSSAYESAIIANDTEESVMQNLINQYTAEYGQAPDAMKLAEFQQAASDAGNMAFSLNVPLVGMSNMIQFPRLFLRNYKSASAAKGLGKINYQAGKHVAAAETNKALKAFGYGKAFLKGPISEAWEEYAQGAMQAGLAEYYTATYNTPDTRSYMDMLEAMRRQGASSLNTVEGRDSVTLGGLMGLLGLRVPVVMRNRSNRFGFSLKTKNFGGSIQEFKAAKEQVREAQQKAEWLNSEGQMSPQLRNNFMNSVRHMSVQRDMDAAANADDTNTFKNKEFDQLFSLIHKREAEGLGDSFNQEFDALEEMGVDEFNEIYATEGIDAYDAESKAKSIAKARKTVQNAQESIRAVQTLANKPKQDIIGKVSGAIRDSLRKNPQGNALDPHLVTEALKEQMAYLHATVNNTVVREAQLAEQIKEKTSHGFSYNSMDKIVAQIVGVNTSTGKAEFIDKAQEVKAEILKDWKENSPNEYHLNVAEVEPLLDDILKLKVRRGEAAKMYQGLFTPKGAKNFVRFTEQLEKASAAERAAKLEEIVQAAADKVRNASIENEARNEGSLKGGESPVVDERINADVLKGVEAIKNIDKEYQPGEMIQADTLRVLDQNPGLLALVKKRLEEKGYSVRGIKVAKEFELLSSPENDILKGLWQELALIEKEADAMAAANASTMEFDSADDMNQASPTDPTEAPSFEKVKGQVLEGMFSFNNRSNRTHTIVNTNDKLISKNEVVIDEDTGKAMPHPAMADPSYPLDPNKVNSPEFLNNKMLDEATHEFEFRVQSIENNKWAQENQDKLNENNFPIEVIYVDPSTGEETFISRLPAFIPGESANQLLALRREVLRRDKLKVDPAVKTRAERIKEIGKELEELDKEIEKKNTMDVGSALSEKAQAKLSKLGFTPEMIKEMTDEDIELAKGMASKEDAKELVDKYDPAKQQTNEVEAKKAELEKVNAQIEAAKKAEIEKRRKPLEKGLERIDKILSGNKQIETEKQAIEVLNEVHRFRKNHKRRGLATKEELAQMNKFEQEAKEKFGLEIVSQLGKKYDERQNIDVTNFNTVENSQGNERLIIAEDKPQINKNGVLTQRARVDVLNGLSKQQYDAELAALEQSTQQTSEVDTKKADETKDVETKRIAKINEEVSEFAINGITDGFNHLVGNKSDAFGDIRGIASKNRGRNFFHTDTKKGKKIFGYIATKMPNGKHIVEYADAMRPGFIAVSVSVPENSSATLEDFKEILEAKAQALLTQSVATQKNLGNETGRVAKFAISNFDKSKPVLKPTQQTSEIEDKKAEEIAALESKIQDVENKIKKAKETKETISKEEKAARDSISKKIEGYKKQAEEREFLEGSGTQTAVRLNPDGSLNDIGEYTLGSEPGAPLTHKDAEGAVWYSNKDNKEFLNNAQKKIKSAQERFTNIKATLKYLESPLVDKFINATRTVEVEELRSKLREELGGDNEWIQYNAPTFYAADDIYSWIFNLVKIENNKKREGLINNIENALDRIIEKNPSPKLKTTKKENVTELEKELETLKENINKINIELAALESTKPTETIEPIISTELLAKQAKLEEELAALATTKSQPITKSSGAKSLEDKVAEIKENQQFIQLSEDGSKYVNSKTGKEYERVTRFIEGEKEEDKGDTTLLDTSAALGTKIDNLVRDFFDDNLQAIERYEIGETEMIEPFLEKLQGVKDAMDARGEKVLANDIVLYNDEIGVAGTVDLLTYDAEGKFRIYDMKTMRGDNFDNSYPGEKVSKYDSDKYGKSKREKHTEQLSMYRILLHNTHGILADTIGVMPIELMYESGDSTTDRLNLLKGVSLTPYDVVKEAKLEVAQEEIQIEPLEDKRKALKQEMSSLSGELVVELDLDSPNVFGKVSDLEGMVESKQAEAEAEIAKEFGDKALSRAEAINDNFQDIIGMIAKSKINIFFDPSTKESKRCP